MSRPPALFLIAAVLVVAVAARSQTPLSSMSPADASQLDRIERKLDEVLRRLDQHPSMNSASGQTKGISGPISSPAPMPTPVVSPGAYKPGALAIVRVAPRDPNSLAVIPADGVGGFVYTGGPIPFSSIGTRGVRYDGPVGAEIQGWLKAKEAGRYEIGDELTVHFGSGAAPTCFFQAWLEDRSLGQRTILVSHPGSNEADATLVLGAELQPGLYRLRLWTVCTLPPGNTTTSEILLKAPSELNLRPVIDGELLHREG